MTKERRLGRGLAALLGTPVGEEAGAAGSASLESAGAVAGSGAGPQLRLADLPGEDGGDAAATDSPAGPAADSPATTSSPVGSPAGGTGSAGNPEGATSAAGVQPEGESSGGARLVMLAVAEIQENPFQPRREFSKTEIASLAESLKTHDMLQPILVRAHGGGYQLISGERRLRAARAAGWQTIPAQIREADDRLVAELAIVENLQRKDLNPVEKALSFRRYLEEHGATQGELAARLQIDRSTVANLMRLLELPEDVLEAVRTQQISAGHARALLPLGEEEQQRDFCRRIQRDGLSVRAVEDEVRQLIQAEDANPLERPLPKNSRTQSEQIASLEQELRLALGTKVELKANSRGKGRIVVHFKNHDEFDRLRSHLMDEPPATRAAG